MEISQTDFESKPGKKKKTFYEGLLPAGSLLVVTFPLVFAVQEALQLGCGGVLLAFGRQGRCLAGLGLTSCPRRSWRAGLGLPVHHLSPFSFVLENDMKIISNMNSSFCN